MENYEMFLGAILVDDYGCEWKVLLYQGDKYRAFSTKGLLLSEAEGSTFDELVKELQGIEEIWIKEIKLKGGK
jgi:hypothetical protein